MFASSHISLLKFTAVGGLVVFIGLRAPLAAGELAQNSEAGEPHMPVLTSVGAVTPLQRALSVRLRVTLKAPMRIPARSLMRATRFICRLIAMVAMAVAEGWQCHSPTRFGSMATTMTHYFA